MRSSNWLAAALLLAMPGTSFAAPNVFWTFGFDLPAHGRVPRFGEIAKDQQFAGAAATPLNRRSIFQTLSGEAEAIRVAQASATVFEPSLGPAKLMSPAYLVPVSLVP